MSSTCLALAALPTHNYGKSQRKASCRSPLLDITSVDQGLEEEEHSSSRPCVAHLTLYVMTRRTAPAAVNITEKLFKFNQRNVI